MEIVTVGVQGPPGAPGAGAGVAAWTYVQEGTPVGGEGYTWFQPSTAYGRIWTGTVWVRIVTEDMMANDNETLTLNAGYF